MVIGFAILGFLFCAVQYIFHSGLHERLSDVYNQFGIWVVLLGVALGLTVYTAIGALFGLAISYIFGVFS